MSNKITLTEEQTEWLREHFPDTSNRECAEHLGISRDMLRKFVRQLSLKKSAEYRHAIGVKAGKASAEAQEGTGYGTAYLVPFKKGLRPIERFGEETERKRVERIRNTMCEMIRKERMRIAWGLPQRTRRKFGYNHKKVAMRGRLKKRGYIIGDTGSVLYYNGSTNRSKVMERNAATMGLTFEPCT